PVPAAAPDVPPAGYAHDTVTAPVFPEPVPAAAPYIPVSKSAPVTAGPEKKKEFFGVGALVACLVVIALLSASTGVFAALYFTTVGAI
ncbi:MAG: hypothetical protein IK093_12730, partial [Ruminiclostridium sp.]|nr:hypothetical protein [Ruminiclostridium sp.]